MYVGSTNQRTNRRSTNRRKFYESFPLKQKTRRKSTKTLYKGTKTDIRLPRPDIRVQSLDSSMTKDSALFSSNYLIVGLMKTRHKKGEHQYQI